jgi:hypothetical protein
MIITSSCGGEGDKYSNYAILERNIEITIETPQGILSLLNIKLIIQIIIQEMLIKR